MLLYQSISWHGADEDLDDESCYVIKNFGRTKEGKSVAASIIGFKPFFYVKVDEIWETSNKYITKLKHFLE